ncbi:MAG: nuclear transport factor 2 family protein [Chitinophagaceae bacterium]|nr:MAG: nuclear transport factor 2 family protein [Chitinophagaceae bacterium]
MATEYDELINTAYSGFNSRDIDKALSTMHAEVEWPKAFEGGYVKGKDAIREYWTRQWSEINPKVEPVAIVERADGTLEISVHQVVRDLKEEVLFDGVVKHVYTLEEGLLRRMDIETQ